MTLSIYVIDITDTRLLFQYRFKLEKKKLGVTTNKKIYIELIETNINVTI